MQSGQSLVEFAFIVPMLLLLLLGLIEVGRYAYVSILVGNAARAGAAYGSQNLAVAGDNTGIATAAQNDYRLNGQNASSLAVCDNTTAICTTVCGCDTAGAFTAKTCSTGPSACSAGGHWVVSVSVTATGTYTSLFHYLQSLDSFTISRTAIVRVNQ